MNILFVCSKNKWRSRTAEEVFKNNGLHIIKSAGTKKSARITINQKLIDWADKIIGMENEHGKFIKKEFQNAPEIIVLGILDKYEFMDQKLVALLHLKVDHVIYGI